MAIAAEPNFTPADNADFLDLVADDVAQAGRSGRARALRSIAAEHRRLADPWRGLYAPEKLERRDDGTGWHPDLPHYPDDREESIEPLLRAQGFEVTCEAGDFSEEAEAMADGGQLYQAEMRAWQPAPPDGWRLAAVCETEDGPAALFVRPIPANTDTDASE